MVFETLCCLYPLGELYKQWCFCFFMVWYWWFVGVVTVYVLSFFVVAPRVIPFMRKEPLPTRIPKALEDAIAQIEKESKTPYEFIKGCSEYILSTVHCGRAITLLKVHLAFERDTKKLLARRGFMHCHHLNHLMRLMLARSSFFSDTDIRLRRTFLNGNVHQYLTVRVAGQWYSVDLGGDHMGVPLGKYAWGLR